jgi:hypothetical protein
MKDIGTKTRENNTLVIPFKGDSKILQGPKFALDLELRAAHFRGSGEE